MKHPLVLRFWLAFDTKVYTCYRITHINAVPGYKVKISGHKAITRRFANLP